MIPELFGSLFSAAFVLALYFLPTIVAWRRNHKNAGAIFALNLLTGWTAIGWVAAIVWSLTANVAEDEVSA